MNSDTNTVSGGVLAAVLTPLDEALEVDLPTYLAHCRRLLQHGCDGLAVLGTTGEANSFGFGERLRILDALAEGGIAPRRLIPGTGCCAIPDTVALTRRCVEMGTAGVLMLPPFYYKPVSDDGLFAAYSEVIQRVGDARLRIYLYHIPQNTGVTLTLNLIEKLVAAYPDTVVGIKDSAGDFANMAAVCKAVPGFRVFSGSDTYLLPLLRAGGAGAITACNNVASALSARIFAAREAAAAEMLQDELSAVREAIQGAPLIPALKEIMARGSGHGGWRRLRPPLTPLATDQAAALFERLDALGFSLELAA